MSGQGTRAAIAIPLVMVVYFAWVTQVFGLSMATVWLGYVAFVLSMFGAAFWIAAGRR